MTADTAPEPRGPVRKKAGVPVWARSVWLVVRDFLVHVLVEPVRDGRMRAERWPRGLAPVAVIAFAGYALAGLAVVGAAQLRTVGELSASTGAAALSLPAWTVGPVVVLVVLALSLAQTAALHVPLWLAVVVTALSSLILVSVGANDIDEGLLSPGRIAAVLATAALWVLLLVRRRRRYAWGEFAVVFALITVGIGVGARNTTQGAADFGIESGPVILASIMQNIGSLAYPAALAAGAAVAQLACSMATESVASVRRHLPVAVGAVLLGALLVWRGWVLVGQFTSGEPVEPAPLIAAVILLAAVSGGWLLVGRIRGTADRPLPAELESRFGEVAQAIAAVLVIAILPTTFLFMLTSIIYAVTFDDAAASPPATMATLLGDERVVWATRLAIGAGLIALAVRDARRGRRTTPELYVAIGVVCVSVAVLALTGLQRLVWTGAALTIVVTAAAVVLLGWWLARRRLTASRGVAIGVALLIAALFDQRTFVEDPLRAVFGFTGLAFVLFGFVWSMLTGAGRANGTSRRYPRSSRVLLFLANALFGVTVLAFAALARDPDATVNLGAPAALGDQLLGTGLLTVALIASLAAAVRMPDVEGPERMPAGDTGVPAVVEEAAVEPAVVEGVPPNDGGGDGR